MNTKKFFFIFIIFLVTLSNLKAQQETLFYGFDKGKVYFYLEFKNRPINNSTDLTEWSWGPSKPKWIKDEKPQSPRSSRKYYLNMNKINYKQTTNQQETWIKINELEKFITGSIYSEESQNKNGYSAIKLDCLPKIGNHYQMKCLRQKIIYYEVINALTKGHNSFKKIFNSLKKQAIESYKKKLKEKKEEEEEMDKLLEEIDNMRTTEGIENEHN